MSLSKICESSNYTDFETFKFFLFVSDQSKTLRVQLETFRKAIEMILESNELFSPEEEKAREAELKAKKMQLAVQEEIFLLNLKKWNFSWNYD